MKEIAMEAYNQFIENYKKVESASVLFKEGKKEIYKIYKQIDKLVNHIIMLNEFEYYTLIFTLSVDGNTKIEKLFTW